MTKIYINNGGIPSLTDTNSVMSGYLPLSGGTMTGVITATGNPNQTQVLIQQSADNSGIRIKGGASDNCAQLYLTGNQGDGSNRNDDLSVGGFVLEASSYSGTKMRLKGNYDGTLTWSGTFKATTLQSTSDIRKKSEIKEVAPDLSSIKTYEYVLKDDGKRHVGLIAQEVEKVIPEAVSEDDDGFKSLDYNSVVAALVGEVNALKKRVAELEEK